MTREKSIQWIKKAVVWSLAVVFGVTMVSIFMWSQEQDQEPIVEQVTVTNVEVPVRVLHKGQPVTDLTIDDFSLFENKKKVKINGFYKKSKTLTITQPQAGETSTAVSTEPRTFVLVFNVSNYNHYFEKAIDHLFDKILLPSDRLMVFANDKTRTYNNLKNTQQIKTQLVSDLKEEGMKAKRRLLDYIQRVETYMKTDDFRREIRSPRGRTQADKMIDFLKRYHMTWMEYQNTYLVPRVDRFYYFARFLERIKGQKWVLNFYQFEFFPRIRPSSRTMQKIRDLATLLMNTNDATSAAQGQNIYNMLNQIESDFVLDRRFPTDEVSKLFYKVDATFHSFFIKTTNTAFLQDIGYNEVSSDVEKILKGITDLTGGKNISSTDLVESLDSVSQVEDTYYVLTYVPEDPKKVGKLKIKVDRKKCDVLYDDNFRADYISNYFNKLEQKVQTPDVKVINFSFKKKVLSFTVSDYLMGDLQGKKAGRVKIHIQLIDSDNNIHFDSAKVLTAQKPELSINIPAFKKIPKGEYNFLINVLDMVTGKEENFHQKVTVKK